MNRYKAMRITAANMGSMGSLTNDALSLNFKDYQPVLTESSAGDLSAVSDLYQANRDWAEAQAQKQMDFQTSANKIAMDFSAAEADKERAFEAEMANTAYQRAVKDLKAAGLNPILAYSQGGAAVPSVSSAQGVTSSGASASMTDSGYTPSQLEYAYLQNATNNATYIFSSILSLAAKLMK